MKILIIASFVLALVLSIAWFDQRDQGAQLEIHRGSVTSIQYKHTRSSKFIRLELSDDENVYAIERSNPGFEAVAKNVRVGDFLELESDRSFLARVETIYALRLDGQQLIAREDSLKENATDSNVGLGVALFCALVGSGLLFLEIRSRK